MSHILEVRISDVSNTVKYIPIIRAYTKESLVDIKKKITSNEAVIICEYFMNIKELSKVHEVLFELENLGAELEIKRNIEGIVENINMKEIKNLIKKPKLIKKQKSYKLSEVVNILRDLYFKGGNEAIYSNSGWCLYLKAEEINLDTVCYIDNYPDFDDDDEETYPLYVIENDLDFKYRDELLQDVICSALYSKSNATNEELMNAVFYYDKHDSFLEL